MRWRCRGGIWTSISPGVFSITGEEEIRGEGLVLGEFVLVFFIPLQEWANIKQGRHRFTAVFVADAQSFVEAEGSDALRNLSQY